MGMLECGNGLSHESRGRPRGRFQDGDGGVAELTSISRSSVQRGGTRSDGRQVSRHDRTAQSDGRRWWQRRSANQSFRQWLCFGPYPATSSEEFVFDIAYGKLPGDWYPRTTGSTTPSRIRELKQYTSCKLGVSYAETTSPDSRFNDDLWRSYRKLYYIIESLQCSNSNDVTQSS